MMRAGPVSCSPQPAISSSSSSSPSPASRNDARFCSTACTNSSMRNASGHPNSWYKPLTSCSSALDGVFGAQLQNSPVPPRCAPPQPAHPTCPTVAPGRRPSCPPARRGCQSKSQSGQPRRPSTALPRAHPHRPRTRCRRDRCILCKFVSNSSLFLHTRRRPSE